MYIKTTDDLGVNEVALASRLVMYALDKNKFAQADAGYAKLLERYYQDDDFRRAVGSICEGFGVIPFRHSGREQLILRRLISRKNRKHPILTVRINHKDDGIRAVIMFGVCVSFYRDRGGLVPLIRGDLEVSDENAARGEAIYEFIQNYAQQIYNKQENKNQITPCKVLATMDSDNEIITKEKDENGGDIVRKSRRTFGHHFEQVIKICLEEAWIEERKTAASVYECLYAPTERLMAILANLLTDDQFKNYLREASALTNQSSQGDQ